MSPIYIFRHATHEGPGYLQTVLESHGLPYHIVAIDTHDAVPDSVQGMNGLIFMGGPMSVNDHFPWIAQEIALIKQAKAQNLPVLGLCLGGQLIAKALGAKVGANPVKEIGWHPVHKLSSAQKTEWLQDLPHQFDVFHWHGETFELPDGATALLSSGWCKNQAFAMGKMLAFQFHIEMTADMVRDWADVNCSEIATSSPSVQSALEMISGLNRRVTALNHLADLIVSRWLRLGRLIPSR